ncbi:MAG: hypothetical protein NTW04_05685, partial [Elusimicrobia bacterium]|nr:hypothetical protein [Elusimicrobiota bacterium]
MKKYAKIFAALWFLAAGLVFLRLAGSEIIYRLWSILVFAFICAAAYLSGGKILAFFGKDIAPSATFRVAASFSLGLAAVSYATFLLGALKILYPQTAAGLLIALIWFGRAHIPVRINFPSVKNRSPLEFTVAGLLLIIFAGAFVPVHQYDSLVYHMALPQMYALKHGIYSLPQNFFSHFPQNAEMLFTLGILFNSDIAAQLMSWLCLAVSCLWIYSISSSALALLFLVSHTAVMLFVTAAVVCFVFFKQNRSWPLLVFCAIFCGMALGIKYYSGICAAV